MSRRRPRAMCSHPGCDRLADYRKAGVCAMHYQRMRRAHELQPEAGPRGQDHNAWKGDAVGYDGAHARVEATFGPAREYVCAACPGRALDWAVQPWAEPMLRDDQGRDYSPDPECYRPMCRSCHNGMDHATDRARRLRSAGLDLPGPEGHRDPLVPWDGHEGPPPAALFPWPDGGAS